MRLADPHFNIFHPYRGPTTRDASNERQLENNLTRALAICLTRLGTCPARTLLLHEFGIAPHEADDFVRCELQVGVADPDWPPPSKRHIAVVTGTAVEADSNPYSAVSGVLDMAICGKGFVVGVESKLGSKVADGHLAAHAKTLGISVTDPVPVTWAALARRARLLLADNGLGPVSEFVLQQFEEYLRMNGFGGFTNDHFAYFTLGPEDRARAADIGAGIRRQMRDLILGIRDGWHTEFDEHVGKLGAFATLKPSGKSSGGSGGQPVHFSVSILPDGLEIFFNVETDRAYRQFVKSWQERSGEFLELLRGLSPTADGVLGLSSAWRFQVGYRIPLATPRASRWEPSLDIAAFTASPMPDETLQAVIGAAIKQPPKGWSPEIKVVRRRGASAGMQRQRPRRARSRRRSEPRTILRLGRSTGSLGELWLHAHRAAGRWPHTSGNRLLPCGGDARTLVGDARFRCTHSEGRRFRPGLTGARPSALLNGSCFQPPLRLRSPSRRNWRCSS